MKRLLFSLVLVVLGFSSFYTNSHAVLGSLINVPSSYVSVGTPQGVLPVSNGEYWYTDVQNYRIVKVDASGNIVRTVGKQGNGEGDFSSEPRGITKDLNGFLYVIESSCKVTKLDSNGGFIERWGQCGGGNSQMNSPRNIYYDQYSNTLFVTDWDSKIHQFTMSGAYVTQFGTWGDGNGQFNNIEGIATDANGKVYVVDTDHHRVQVFNSTFEPAYLPVTYDATPAGLPDGFTTGVTGTGGAGWERVEQTVDDASAASGFIDAGQTSWIETTVNITGSSEITFDFKIDDAADYMYVCINSSDCSYYGDYYSFYYHNDDLWHTEKLEFPNPGTYTIRIAMEKWAAYNEARAYIDNFSSRTTSEFNDFQSIDFPGTNWTIGGDVPWTRDTSSFSPKANNTTSFQSGGIFDYTTTWLSKSVNYDIDYTLSFDWKVSSEQDYDFLLLCVDDDSGCNSYYYQTNIITGLVDWTSVSVDLPAGPHTITWKYEKDSSYSMNFDGGWVDNIVFTPVNSPLSNVPLITFDYTFGSYGTGDGQFVFPNGIGIQSNGNIVVTSQNSQRVHIFDSTGNWISTFGSTGSGDGQFNLASKLAIDASDNIYITDPADNTVQKFGSTGNFISKFGNSSLAAGKLRNPKGVAYDSTGNLYVIDSLAGAGRIQKFSSMGNYIATIVPNTFYSSYIIYIDDSDNLFVSNRIEVRKYDLSGNLLLTIGSEGSANGQFRDARGIAVDDQGYIYVSDVYNYRITKFDSSGNYVSKWGTQGSADGEFDGLTTIAFDSNYNLYVVDSNNNRVQKFTKAGVHLQTITNGFSWPMGLVVDGNDNIYVTEAHGSRYQKFDSNGNHLYSFGSFGSGLNKFYEPFAIAINPLSGRVAVADNLNNRVQVFSEGVRINNITSSLDVVRASDSQSLVNGLFDPQEAGINSIGSELVFGDYIVSDLNIDLSTDRDWGIVSATSVPSASKALLVNLDPVNAPGASATHSLYIVQGVNQNSAHICPTAVTMSDITQSCSGGYDLVIGVDPSISSVNIHGVDYLKIDGLTGTGALGLSVTPPTPDGRLKLTPNTSAASTTQEVVISYIPTSLFIATDTIEFHFEPGAGFVLANTCAGGATVDANGTGGVDGSATIVGNDVYRYTFDAPIAAGPLSFCVNVTSPVAAGSYSVRLTDDNGTFDSTMYYVGGDNNVFVIANVAPTLSFNIRDIDNTVDTNVCSFGTVSASSNVPNYNNSVGDNGNAECGYSLAIGTNAVSGFAAYVQADGALQSSSTQIANVSSVFSAGIEGYGFALLNPALGGRNITTGLYTEHALQDYGIANLANPVPTVPTQLFSYPGGFEYKSTNPNTNVNQVIHGLVVGSGTPAGYYQQVITYTVTANF
jgi:sugar lactone lactonase YvrE